MLHKAICLLLLFWHGVVGADTDGSVSNSTEMTEIHVKEISTSSITIHWRTGDADLESNVTSWKVQYQRGGDEHLSEELPLSVRHFTISDLDVDTTYFICVFLSLRQDNVRLTEEPDSQEPSVCRTVRTIPYMRKDSIIAMTLTVTAFSIVILSAVLTWRRAKSNFMKLSSPGLLSYDDEVELKNLEQREPLKRNYSIEESR